MQSFEFIEQFFHVYNKDKSLSNATKGDTLKDEKVTKKIAIKGRKRSCVFFRISVNSG